MGSRVVAVFGISGVGKTTLIESFVKAHEWSLHVRASELLRQTTSNFDSLDLVNQKHPDQFMGDQESIVEQFEKIRRKNPKKHIIFDGHSLIVSEGKLLEVPVELISRLSPRLILFVQASPECIYENRMKDERRIRPLCELDELSIQQDMAKKVAQSYGTKLGVPCMLIESGDNLDFKNAILKSI